MIYFFSNLYITKATITPNVAVISCVVPIAVLNVVTNFSGKIPNKLIKLNNPNIIATFTIIPTTPAKK